MSTDVARTLMSVDLLHNLVEASMACSIDLFRYP